ncbi:MAG: hypothetical protein Tsb0017_25720 [Geothermobacteraceae bacterium]
MVRFDDVAGAREDVLRHVMGPSGNLRAPTLRCGDDVIVGFNAELYSETWN